jgi:hypothetical protein
MLFRRHDTAQQGSKTINCQLIGDPDQAIKLQLF